MSSDFKNKLKRLHQSRIRALEENESDQNRVFVAEPESTPPKPDPKPRGYSNSDPTFVGLKRAIKLEEKSGPRPKQSTRQSRPARPTTSAVGDRVAQLRKQLEGATGTESAALLFEIVAIQPDNTFALTRIVQHYRSSGQTDLAELFAKRLKEHSPF